MLLRDLLYRSGSTAIHGNPEQEISGITSDSREVIDAWLFAAIEGAEMDGHSYIDQAVSKGASAIICENLPEVLKDEVAYALVPDSRLALANIAANFYGHPSKEFKLTGVTGTNGKSTVATLLYKLFTNLGYYCGLLSTIEYRVGKNVIPASHTTPDPVQLQRLMAQMRDAGCDYVFMEVSSHAVHQKRTEALAFDLGIFTNITHDHLDYHGSFRNYIEAKKAFFDGLASQSAALYNSDDKNGKVMVQNSRARKYSFGIRTPADFQSRILENSFDGLLMNCMGRELHSPFVGEFNAYNLTACFAAASILEIDEAESLEALSGLAFVPGRFERVDSRLKKIGIVDYAHTPDALRNVLATITAIREDGQKIITVVGCGGDRDREKRPLMAEIGARFSDKLILTSDNPRSEDPDEIIEEMYDGVPLQHRRKVLKLASRDNAIKTAGMLATSGDIVLVAGKGHERTQEIQGVKTPFDDRKVLKEALD